MAMTDDELTKLRKLCDEATPPPWHYFPYGEKSNDCVLGAAVGEDEHDCPPPGRVDLHPYNEDADEYERDKYIMDPSIAFSEDHANYADFAFMAHARSALPMLLDEVKRLRRELACTQVGIE